MSEKMACAAEVGVELEEIYKNQAINILHNFFECTESVPCEFGIFCPYYQQKLVDTTGYYCKTGDCMNGMLESLGFEYDAEIAKKWEEAKK